jgi:hypothetical protein
MYSVQGDAVDQANWKAMPSLWESPASGWWKKLTDTSPSQDSSFTLFRKWPKDGNIYSWQSLPQVWKYWAAPNKTQFLDAPSARQQVLSMWALWGEVFLCAWSRFYQLALWRGCLARISGLVLIYPVVFFPLSLPTPWSGTFRNNLGI